MLQRVTESSFKTGALHHRNWRFFRIKFTSWHHGKHGVVYSIWSVMRWTWEKGEALWKAVALDPQGCVNMESKHACIRRRIRVHIKFRTCWQHMEKLGVRSDWPNDDRDSTTIFTVIVVQ